MARADRHALLVHDGREVVWVHVPVPEGHRSTTDVRVRRTEHPGSSALQAFERVRRDLALVLTYRLHPEGFQIVDGCPQADQLGDVHGPALELVRRLLPRGVVVEDLVDHLASTDERFRPVNLLNGPDTSE